MSTIFLNEKESSFAKAYKESLSSEITKGGPGSGGAREGAGRPSGSTSENGGGNHGMRDEEIEDKYDRMNSSEQREYDRLNNSDNPSEQIQAQSMIENVEDEVPSWAEDADEEEVEVELLSSGQSVPVNITESMREAFGDSRSANEAVNRFLDDPSNAKWFDDKYSGNEFDLKHDIENLVNPRTRR
jgi:hypothetical protein